MSTTCTRGHWPLVIVAGVLLLALLGACQPITAENATLPWLNEQESGETVSAADLDKLNETETILATRAIDDLANELDVEPEEITLVSMEPVDWPDASLGCPEPDMMYAAMLTPGYRIELSVGDETVTYHSTTDADGPLVHCEASE